MNKFSNKKFSGNEWLEGIILPPILCLVDDEKVDGD